jgi:hypothetical protein
VRGTQGCLHPEHVDALQAAIAAWNGRHVVLSRCVIAAVASIHTATALCLRRSMD